MILRRTLKESFGISQPTWMCWILCSPFLEATNHLIRRLFFLQRHGGLDRMPRHSPAAQSVPATTGCIKRGTFKKLGAVSLIPDSRRPAFITGFGSMQNAGGARHWHQPWWCGLEQRSQVGPARLPPEPMWPSLPQEPPFTCQRVKGFDKMSYPHLGWSKFSWKFNFLPKL
jgi:hypothetical protein